MPAIMWSSTWQWKSQMPGLSGTMSATRMLAGSSSMTSVRRPCDGHDVSVPVGRVQVALAAEADQIPAHPLPHLHPQPRHVAENIAIDGEEAVGVGGAREHRGPGHHGHGHRHLFILVRHSGGDRARGEEPGVHDRVVADRLVEDAEQRDEFAVDVARRAVRTGGPAPRDDDHPDQPGRGVPHGVDVGMVEPDHRARIAGPGARPFRHVPVVGVGLAGRDGVVGQIGSRGAVGVAGPLVRLGVEHPMGMQADRDQGVVLEGDLDAVADLGADHRARAARGAPIPGARGLSVLKVASVYSR